MKPPAGVRGSLQIRHVDAGSCNGCEVEISGAFGPVYDAERFGARLVASPRHADALLVTGVVTHNMAGPLRTTVDATPRPRVVIACGDCALNRGVFGDAYGVVGAVGEVVPVDVEIPGCPPTPSRDRRGAAIGDRQVTAALLVASAAPAPNLIAPQRLQARLRGRADVAARCGRGVGRHAGDVRFGSRGPHRVAASAVGGAARASIRWAGSSWRSPARSRSPSGCTRSGTPGAGIWAGSHWPVLPMFVAAMLLVPAAGSVTTFLLAWELMAVASLVLVLAEHTRAAGSLGGIGVRGDDPARVRGDPGRADGVVGGRWGGPVRRPASDAARRAHRGVSVDDGGVRVEGRAGAAARLVAARPSGGAQPGVGADERGDGQPRRLRHLPLRPAAARAGSALVGAHLDGRRRGVGALRRGAGLGGHGSQTAACLFDDREPGVDHAGAGSRDAVRGLRRARRRRRSPRPRRCCT